MVWRSTHCLAMLPATLQHGPRTRRMKSGGEHHIRAVQKALDSIEGQLRGPIDLEPLARDSGMSFWHFQRTFASLVGEPLAGYIRRRRLTAAARELRRTRRPIVEIAFEFRFDSHESFTRAFRSAFALTPHGYRQSPGPLRPSRARLDVSHLHHLRRINAEPAIVDRPELHLVGLSARYLGVTAERPNDTEVIPALWTAFRPRLPELGAGPETETYGAWDFLPAEARSDPDEYAGLAAVAVPQSREPPAGMVKWFAPAGRYARFTHRGPARHIRDTISYVYAAWLPRSAHERGPGFDYLRFDTRFADEDENSECDYFLPLAG